MADASERGFPTRLYLDKFRYESSSLFRFGRIYAATSAVYCQVNCSSQQATLLLLREEFALLGFISGCNTPVGFWSWHDEAERPLIAVVRAC